MCSARVVYVSWSSAWPCSGGPTSRHRINPIRNRPSCWLRPAEAAEEAQAEEEWAEEPVEEWAEGRREEWAADPVQWAVSLEERDREWEAAAPAVPAAALEARAEVPVDRKQGCKAAAPGRIQAQDPEWAAPEARALAWGRVRQALSRAEGSRGQCKDRPLVKSPVHETLEAPA